MSEQVTILYIGGRGRSGSTLLARMLGQIPGFVDVGELNLVWERGFRENQLCGCEQPFHSCEFWDAVVYEAFGDPGNVDIDKILTLKTSLVRVRRALAMRTRMQDRRTDELLTEYGAILDRLYLAIQKVSGARVIVDSSKGFPYALLLNALPFADLRVLHLVRDSRAVAYSWTKAMVRPEVLSDEVLMPRFGPVRASYEWNLRNYLFSLLPQSTMLSLLRYEDLVSDPARYVDTVLAEVGLDEIGCLPLVDEQTVSLGVSHTVSGNPNRFQTGTISLRLDEEWRTKMKSADKYAVTTLTAPLLLKYGYFGGNEKSK